MTVEIRAEAPPDFAAIDALHQLAFANDTHSLHNEAAIVRALRQSNTLSLSLVAVQAGRVVGHLALSPVNISDGTTGWYGVGPVAVLPQWQGHGIGSGLIREALRQLRRRGAAGCVLLGEPAFYRRFGFATVPDLVLVEVPPEYFMALSFDGSKPKGIVTYQAAFNVPACAAPSAFPGE